MPSANCYNTLTNENKQTKKQEKQPKNQQKQSTTRLYHSSICKSIQPPSHSLLPEQKPYTELFNVRLSCRLSAKSSTNSLNFCESPKSCTLNIGDYQSLVLRSVRITILLNHDNAGHRANDFNVPGNRETPISGITDIAYRGNSFRTQLRHYEALDMVQEEQPNKFILLENARCSLMVTVFI